MKIIIIFLSICCTISNAQTPTLEVSGAGIGSFGGVKYNNPSAIGQKNVDKLDYSDVDGKCFWDNDWNPGLIILNNGRTMKMPRLKLNYYTNDIHYTDVAGKEFVIPTGLVKKLIFFTYKDTANVSAIFENFKGTNSNIKDAYFQILNDGDFQLMKSVNITLVKKTYDPMVGKDEYRFIPSTDYYIRNNGVVSPMKALNKTSLFSIIKPTEESEKWLSSNKNKLKNQNDILEFLAFLNSAKK